MGTDCEGKSAAGILFICLFIVDVIYFFEIKMENRRLRLDFIIVFEGTDCLYGVWL